MKLTSLFQSLGRTAAWQALCCALLLGTAPAAAQTDGTARVSGQVTDRQGEAIIGATIQEQGTGQGAATDFDGRFSMDVTAPATLTISYIGYEPETVRIDGPASDLHIVLEESAETLDELVVIGYGTVRKRDLTGAIASVQSDELNLSRSTLEQALVGHTPGVQIKQTSGAPGASSTIRIRGVNSVYSGAEPLYVIDGFPASDNYINPEDVASIEFLKDAASAAIYGSRAAGGVVLITTKRGQAGKAKVEYDFQYSRQGILKKIDLMNASELRQLHIEGATNNYLDHLRVQGIISGNTSDEILAQMARHYNDDNDTRLANDANIYMLLCPDIMNSEYDTDWQDALFTNAGMMRHNFSVTGGREGFRYMFSLGYLDQDGIIAPGNHKRLNGRLNMDIDVTKRFSIGVNTALRYVNERTVRSDGLAFNDGLVLNALMGLPQYKVYEDDGSYAVGQSQENTRNYGTVAFENPLAMAHYNQQFYKRNRSSFGTELRYQVLDGLLAKVTGGLVINDQIYRYYRNGGDVGSSNYDPGDYDNLARARNDRDYNTEWLLEATLNYNKTLADKHTINAVAGYSMQTKVYDNINTNGKNFESDRIPEISGAGGELGDTDATTDRAAWSLMSYFGRAIYTYDNRYNLSVSMRADGCSRFGRDSRWGYFPSVSAGWTVSEEDFFSPAADFMSMKLRASWGVSGNNNIGNYRHIANMAQTYYVFGSEVVNAYYPSGFTDQELSWETTRQTNVGLDLGFFRNRLRLTGNYYYSVTRDLLYQMTTSAFTGGTSYWTNMEDGRVYNHGFDLQVDGAILAGKNWKWNMGFNVSLNRNKVMGLEDEVIEKAQRSQITHITRNGEPIGSYYGMVSQGIITKEDYDNILIDKQHQGEEGYELLGPAVNNYEEVFIGDVKWKDVNGDGQITEDDRDIIGNNYPDFTFGLYTTVSYKGLSLSATFDGQYGADVINFSRYYICNMEGSVNTMTVANTRYRSEQEPGDGLYYRANRQAKNLNTKFSTYFVEDASFFRCTNITLGYDIPRNKVFDALNISRLNVYGSVDNLFMLTNYLGYNPDVDYNGSSNLTPGVDFGTYPLSRTFSVGLKLTFN